MKKQIVTLALTTFLGLGSIGIAAPAPQDQQAAPQDQVAPAPSAQPYRKPDPNRQIKMLTKRLNLTADQQNQLLPILSDRDQQIAGIQADNALSPKDRHAKMRAVREDTDTKIRGLLNDNQKLTYDQMQQQRRERMQHRNGQDQNAASV